MFDSSGDQLLDGISTDLLTTDPTPPAIVLIPGSEGGKYELLSQLVGRTSKELLEHLHQVRRGDLNSHLLASR